MFAHPVYHGLQVCAAHHEGVRGGDARIVCHLGEARIASAHVVHEVAVGRYRAPVLQKHCAGLGHQAVGVEELGAGRAHLLAAEVGCEGLCAGGVGELHGIRGEEDELATERVERVLGYCLEAFGMRDRDRARNPV